jgi:hypothetical protein
MYIYIYIHIYREIKKVSLGVVKNQLLEGKYMFFVLIYMHVSVYR